MDYERTEEEQVAALKRWWSENGSTLIIGVSIALAVVFGYQAWQKNIQNQKYEGSGLYQQILEAASNQAAENDDKNISTIKLLGSKLKAEHEGTEYANFAALYLAKMAVEEGDLEQAEKELLWVLALDPEVETKSIANARLARVVAGQGRVDEALSIVNGNVTDTFKPMYLEIKGDIELGRGNRDVARQAYQQAKDLLAESDRNRILLEMKLSDLVDVEGV